VVEGLERMILPANRTLQANPLPQMLLTSFNPARQISSGEIFNNAYRFSKKP
jgi:hypothetical protein